MTMLRNQRVEWLDALRGAALLWMTVFHFSFDLNNAGLIHQNFHTDTFWTWQRTCILSLFLLCAGAGQALAQMHGQSRAHFARRLLHIGGCALLVTAGSWWMFPRSFIYFGVLHSMVLLLLIVRCTVGWGRWLWPLGALAVASKFVAAYVLGMEALAPWAYWFNTPWLNWLGWITQKPVTEDYVPIFPWLGVMWWGMAGMQSYLRRWGNRAKGQPVRAGVVPIKPSSTPGRRALRGLACWGRWSLSYYMLHQPVLLAALWLGMWLWH